MKKSIKVFVTIIATLFLSNIADAQKDSCSFCLYGNQYFSDGAIVVQSLGSYSDMGLPFICKKAEWYSYGKIKIKPLNIEGIDKIDKDALEKAEQCEMCLYANMAFIKGSVLCLPEQNFGDHTKFINYTCQKGKWLKSGVIEYCNE